MIVAGCDVGSLSAKAVIMKDNDIIGTSVVLAGTNPARSAEKAMGAALADAGIAMADITKIVATGYGKEMIPFAHASDSEIVCHAKGAYWCLPQTRTIIDIGGQDAKAIRLDDQGNVVRYRYNDKCASGTGRFLEVMADALEVKLDDMGDMASQSTEKLMISNQCVIFAETEVVSLVNEGKAVSDIIKALHIAMAGRVASMVLSIGPADDIVMTGGGAKNSGLFQALGGALKKKVQSLNGVDPQINGALGAALIAKNGRNSETL